MQNDSDHELTGLIITKKKLKIFPYFFIAPFFIAFVVFSLYPAVYSLILGFFNWDGIDSKKFIGILNFIKIFHDPYFLQSLGNTILFMVISTPITIFLACAIAFMLNNMNFKGTPFFRAAMFLPNVTTPIAVGILFLYIFDWNYGILNIILSSLGLMPNKINWTGDARYTWVLIVSLVVWRWFGYHMVIILAAMQSIPNELFEAANIDGANKRHCFFKITLPLIKPTIIFLAITSIIGGLSLFDEPMIIYGPTGGPSNSASTLALYVYNTVFMNNRWGYGAAMCFIIFIIGIACSIAFYKATSREN